MDNAQWQRRLENLTDSPELQIALLSLKGAEEEYEAEVLGRLFGYQAISNCFQAFTANTVSTVENQIREHPSIARPSNSTVLLMRVAAGFRGFRAANNLFLRGYPLPGFVLLRNIKDWALMIAAVGNGLTTLTRLNGLAQSSDTVVSSPTDMDAIRKQRMKEERRVLDVVLRGSASGLDVSVRSELRAWEDLFNVEVHAALGSIALEGISWLNGDNNSLLHSRFSDKPMLAFTNRACEVAWMILRILPLLQVTPAQFDAVWVEGWKILDESFRFLSLALAAEGKPIGAAIAKLLEKKFNFSPEFTCYAETMA